MFALQKSAMDNAAKPLVHDRNPHGRWHGQCAVAARPPPPAHMSRRRVACWAASKEQVQGEGVGSVWGSALLVSGTTIGAGILVSGCSSQLPVPPFFVVFWTPAQRVSVCRPCLLSHRKLALCPQLQHSQQCVASASQPVCLSDQGKSHSVCGTECTTHASSCTMA